ncbi:hypothetical protein [Maribellus maritimus]|uniref:hypothetical protein n=1 Tax=Maribellus maritimus TaxID=2870838 RepID=UPI001EEBF99F|nr:hypothetical protein [Maribellus maritimus]MCG6189066.1 hypothetical protein [Maribellus maritimus]
MNNLNKTEETLKFITINRPDPVAPDGSNFFVQGINPGNWLNPEGYKFRFRRAGSARLIDQAFREMPGPDFTNEFWRQFKDHYISYEDVLCIKSTLMTVMVIRGCWWAKNAQILFVNIRKRIADVQNTYKVLHQIFFNLQSVLSVSHVKPVR